MTGVPYLCHFGFLIRRVGGHCKTRSAAHGFGLTDPSFGGQNFPGRLQGGSRRLSDFLALWKDADPDIPILIAAKAEYAKLK
ncbi:MAG: hypothetical protein WBC04_20200 [Candidatus Acidiferrales bacterium]